MTQTAKHSSPLNQTEVAGEPQAPVSRSGLGWWWLLMAVTTVPYVLVGVAIWN